MVKQFRSMTYPYVAWISVMIVPPMLLIVLAFTVSGNEVLICRTRVSSTPFSAFRHWASLMIHTSFAVILGMVYNFIPFMILQIHTSLAKMERSLLEPPTTSAPRPLCRRLLRVTLRSPFPASFPASRSCSCPPFPASSFQKLLGGGQFVPRRQHH